MAEKLGEATLYLTTDNKDFDSGIDNSKKKSEGLTGAMVKGMAIFELFKQAIGFVVDKVKESIEAYAEAEKIQAQLGAVLKSTGYAAGLTAEGVNDIATNLSKLTGIEDDSIVKAENLLLTFTKIGKDVFPLATETILDMSTALGQSSENTAIQVGKMLQSADAMAAAKRVGVSFTDEQIKLGKELEASGRMAEYQAMVLKELQTEFGGSARAARDTFGGALTALQNEMGNSQETIGQYIAIIGRPFVEEMITMTEGINDFLTSKEGMETVITTASNLAGTFSVLGKMGESAFNNLKTLGGTVFKDLEKAFKQVVGESLKGVSSFDVLGGVVQAAGIAFSVIGKIISFVIKVIADLVTSIQKSVTVLVKFGEAMLDPLNPKKWEQVGDATGAAINAFKDLGLNAFNNIKDIITETQKEFENFNEGAKKNSKELEETFNASGDAIEKSFKDFTEKLNKEKEEQKKAVEEIGNTTVETSKTLAEELTEIAQKMEKGWSNTADNIVNAMNTVGKAVAPVFESIGAALFEQGDAWKNVGKAAVYAIANIVKALGDQLAAMAAKELIVAIAETIKLNPLAALNYAASGAYGAGAAAAYVTSGAIRAWGDTFKDGGIVGGNSFTGDQIGIRVNSGEMILTQSDQLNLLNMIRGGIGSGSGLAINNNFYGDVTNIESLQRMNELAARSYQGAVRQV